MRTTSFFFLSLVGALAACSSSSSKAPPPAPTPTIQVDDETCATQLETVAILEGVALFVDGFTVGPDETIYFTRMGAHEPDGLFALEPGNSTPRRLTPPDAYVNAEQLWVEGDVVLMHEFGRLLSVPRAGGPATVLAQLSPNPDPQTLPGAAALDATHLYVGLLRYGADGKELQEMWRLPREGGAPELLYSGLSTSTPALWNASLVVDGDSIYFGASASAADGYGGLYRMPKSGGAPTMLRRAAYDDFTGGIALVGTDLYSTPVNGSLTRWPLDSVLAPTTLAGVGGGRLLVSDKTTAYVGFHHLLPDDAKNGYRSRFAFARVPNGVESVALTACTDARPSSSHDLSPRAIALGASYVYALLEDMDAKDPTFRFEIVRMRR